MNIVKVSIKVRVPLHRETNTNRYWVGYFDGIPTLEKLIGIVRADLGYHSKNILSVLQAAESMEVTKNLTCLVTLVMKAGVQIGVIEYEKVAVFSLKDDECDWDLLIMNS